MSSFLCVFVCLFFITPKEIPNTQAVLTPGVPVRSVTELSENLRVASEQLRILLFQSCQVFSFLNKILNSQLLFLFIREHQSAVKSRRHSGSQTLLEGQVQLPQVCCFAKEVQRGHF